MNETLRKLAKDLNEKLGAKDFAEVLFLSKSILQIDPNHINGLYGKAVALRKLREWSEAEKTVESGLKVHGSAALLLNEQAFISCDRGHWQKALAGFQATLEVDPKNETALEWTVTCHCKLWDFEAAQAAVERALVELPKSSRLLSERAYISYELADWQKALAGFQAALQADPTNEDALAGAVLCHRRLRNFEAARRAIQDAEKTLPNCDHVHLVKGLAFLEDGNLADAEKAFEWAARLSPESHEPVFLLVNVLVRSNRRREALRRLHDLRQRFPADAGIGQAIGLTYLRTKEYAAAKREFYEILATDADNEQAKHGLARVMVACSQFRAAQELWDELGRQNLHQLEFQTSKAQALSRIGTENDLRIAEEICEGVLRLERVNAEALACLGVIHYKRGRWRDSEECLIRAIELSPAVGPYRDLGALYAKQGRNEQAEIQLKRAIEIDKLDTRAYIELGSLYFDMNRQSDAIGRLRQAVATDRNSAEAIKALAQGFIRQGNVYEAEQELRDGIKRLDPRDCFGLHIVLARLLTQLASNTGDVILLEEALQHATKAMKLKPYDPDGYFEYGMAQNALNSPVRALRSFNECLKRAPEHLEAQRNIERLKKLLSMEQTARRSDVAGITISVGSFVLLLALWGLFLQQPLDRVSGNKELNPRTQFKNAETGNPKPTNATADALAKQETSESGSEAPFEPKIDRSMILVFTPMLLALIVMGVDPPLTLESMS